MRVTGYAAGLVVWPSGIPHALRYRIAVAAVTPLSAQGTPKNSDEILRQRILLRERFNKGWDVQIENSRDRIEGRCKAEARKRYSVIHPLKRRKFTKDCIRRARR